MNIDESAAIKGNIWMC